ncbi:hypothetical protein [Brevibacillus massiliensis]|jgi:hypothetical protein|uniref:hypothetical protein n=1 Tax=Brevibacillus massiliensis TaxID=1118054 RepID=UPI0011CB72D6|nr:hypothetical protein [Brevibacillus massiliensis]
MSCGCGKSHCHTKCRKCCKKKYYKKHCCYTPYYKTKCHTYHKGGHGYGHGHYYDSSSGSSMWGSRHMGGWHDGWMRDGWRGWDS